MQISKLLHSKRNRYALIAGAIFFLVVLSLIFIFARQKAGPSIVGKDDGTVLTDYSGKSVRFDQYTNVFTRKPLVVYFWATWCTYCSEEFAHLGALKQQYGDNIQILAVNRGESIAEAKQYTDMLPPTNLILLLDSNDVLFKKLGGYAMPETIFINSHGEEVFHKHGPISNEEIGAAAIGITK